jgi:hypothetical protein
MQMQTMMRRGVAAICLSMAAVLCASDAPTPPGPEQIYVQVDAVKIFGGPAGYYPKVGDASKGAALTVVARQGKWIHVTVASDDPQKPIDGFVYEGSTSPNKPGLDQLVSKISIKSELSEGEASKGLGPSATTYAQGKNLKTDDLDALIKFRKSIDPKDVDAFCAAGKVGPAKP